MLPGFHGHLISECFLESQLQKDAEHRDTAYVRRRLAAWRRPCRSLGPSSSALAIFEVAGAPLLHALGFASPSDVEVHDGGLVSATVGRGSPRIGLLVAPWGNRLDALWRPAVIDAAHRSAAWCLLFNGTHLRIVDAARLHSRRYAEFDLD